MILLFFTKITLFLLFSGILFVMKESLNGEETFNKHTVVAMLKIEIEREVKTATTTADLSGSTLG